MKLLGQSADPFAARGEFGGDQGFPRLRDDVARPGRGKVFNRAVLQIGQNQSLCPGSQNRVSFGLAELGVVDPLLVGRDRRESRRRGLIAEDRAVPGRADFHVAIHCRPILGEEICQRRVGEVRRGAHEGFGEPFGIGAVGQDARLLLQVALEVHPGIDQQAREPGHDAAHPYGKIAEVHADRAPVKRGHLIERL